ncbi:hypothetical protein [Microbulbifer discodermiae]|uniref:hypothetical protein n=1 Tax=Microbulbifer sp. 2201CG32-9 TaxID=3232309 RepID=UPI00345BDB9A
MFPGDKINSLLGGKLGRLSAYGYTEQNPLSYTDPQDLAVLSFVLLVEAMKALYHLLQVFLPIRWQLDVELGNMWRERYAQEMVSIFLSKYYSQIDTYKFTPGG